MFYTFKINVYRKSKRVEEGNLKTEYKIKQISLTSYQMDNIITQKKFKKVLKEHSDYTHMHTYLHGIHAKIKKICKEIMSFSRFVFRSGTS